jgi:chromosome segregation ATPase
MNNKDLIIIALILALIYLYYQNRKLKGLSATDNSQTIFEVVDHEDLIADKDQAIRDKNEAEAENLSLSNKLKLKSKEVENKDKEIQRLKEEKSTSEIALNKKLTELKKKYSEREKLLDTEQLECKKLEEKNEKLHEKITDLERALDKNDDLDDFQTWLNENEERKNNLPEWDKVIQEVKNKTRNYHLQKSSWSSNWLKNNREYWEIFSNWLNSADSAN